MTRQELKDRAKAQLGNNIFGNKWLIALAVLLIYSAILGVLSATGVGSIAAIIVTGPLMFGVTTLFLNQARTNEQMDIPDMFCGFSNCFGDSLLLGLMISIFTFLWSLLFVIPGIVKAYSYSMAYYIKVDNPEYDWRQCIQASMNLMEGHKADLFVLDLSFIGWYIVGSLCFGVGTLWVAPYHQATRAQFYESIKTVDTASEEIEIVA